MVTKFLVTNKVTDLVSIKVCKGNRPWWCAFGTCGTPGVVCKSLDSRQHIKKGTTVDPDSPELVDRKVKGLLNKLTMEKFDSISDQIITWANKSEKEKGWPDSYPGYSIGLREGNRRGCMVGDVRSSMPQDDGADQSRGAG
jgi:hypothetical protein